MSDIKSVLKFNDFLVEETVFKRNYVEAGDFDLEFDFNASAMLSESEDKAKLQLTCILFDEDFNGGKAPFYMKTTIVGHFECENVSIQEFEFNAMAILLPYIRAFITSFTSQSGIPPVILPPINVFNYFKRENDSQNQ
ncbi:protein-export chaperone SecB [Metabacillus halosaccharovorans]|uniref:protein-export chaperone SecB n=2 Tax=Metabacillus halosaccharovorans TaxID=930124 RepID=UPI00203F88EA|nr:protein-export chaperone SecB [Metabacillus halosaccharovorans]MCM3444500.1 protein-export chaperone SecB [Metabacillus halosaccharovorans]